MTQLTTEPVSTDASSRLSARVVLGIVFGIVLAIPLGYLLSLAVFLPAMLGLFFFILFGLLIGAAMCRVWTPLRPMKPWTIKLGITLAVLAGWGGALVWEGLTFPSAVAKDAIEQVVKVSGKTGSDVRADAIADTKKFLAERYPPGGVIGYWRWAMADKTIEIPITGTTKPKPILYSGNGWKFIVRVILCGVALMLAVCAMVAPLSKPTRDKCSEP